ncbi:MAG: GntR family transcriptional regulator [Candidatus Sumerlaeota bacterium]
MISERIARALAERIQSGEFSEGARLPSRHQLMRRYKVSRSTVDRALSMLGEQGLVTSAKGAGTFVNTLSQPDLRRVYYAVGGESGNRWMHRAIWQEVLGTEEKSPKFQVVARADLERYYTRITRSDARVIWHCPPLDSYSLIESMNKAHVPQILVNRVLPHVNYVTNDTLCAVELLLDAFGKSTRKKRPTLAILTLEPSVQHPYLAEREQFFQQAASERQWPVSRIVRARSLRHPDLADAAHEMYDGDLPDAIFAPEVLYYAHLTSIMRARRLSVRQRPKLLMTDSVDAQEGVFAVRQNMEEMSEIALRWAAQSKVESLQKRVEPTLVADGQ